MRIVGWKFRLSAAEFFRMMVARDGVEPPTPAPVARAQQEFDKRLADVLDIVLPQLEMEKAFVR